MLHMQGEIISIADACLGGLRGRAALLIGPADMCSPYKQLLQEAGIKTIYEEQDYLRVPTLLPQVHLLMNMPEQQAQLPLLTAATIAQGCAGRRAPLLIFDLASTTSIEEMAGLLPAICLYTPLDLRQVLCARTT